MTFRAGSSYSRKVPLACLGGRIDFESCSVPALRHRLVCTPQMAFVPTVPTINYARSPEACFHQSPSVRRKIMRHADVPWGRLSRERRLVAM